MSDALTFAEIEEQHVELLPARTVLSLFNSGWWWPKPGNAGTNGTNGTGTNGSGSNSPGPPTCNCTSGTGTGGTGGTAKAG